MMECYAASVSHCDYQIGRVLDAIQEQQLDNTPVFYLQGDKRQLQARTKRSGHDDRNGGTAANGYNM